jgi:hypothetical protein
MEPRPAYGHLGRHSPAVPRLGRLTSFRAGRHPPFPSWAGAAAPSWAGSPLRAPPAGPGLSLPDGPALCSSRPDRLSRPASLIARTAIGETPPGRHFPGRFGRSFPGRRLPGRLPGAVARSSGTSASQPRQHPALSRPASPAHGRHAYHRQVPVGPVQEGLV